MAGMYYLPKHDTTVVIWIGVKFLGGNRKNEPIMAGMKYFPKPDITVVIWIDPKVMTKIWREQTKTKKTTLLSPFGSQVRLGTGGGLGA